HSSASADARAAPPALAERPSRGPVVEHAVDEAAGRFATVAALLPDGPLAERGDATRAAVRDCVRGAAPLCGVGVAIAPDWQPDDRIPDPVRRAARLATRVAALVGTIDE